MKFSHEAKYSRSFRSYSRWNQIFYKQNPLQMKFKYPLLILIFIVPIFSSGQEKGNASALVQEFIQSNQQLKSKNNIEYEINFDQYDKNSGVRKVHALQKLNGIYVREGLITLTYGRNKKLYSQNHFSVNKANASKPTIGVETALTNSMRFHKMDHKSPLVLKENKSESDLHVIYERSDDTASDIQARLMYIQTRRNDELTLTWETQLHTADRQNYWITYVDANSGKVLDSKDMVLHCSFGGGLVYDASPEEQAILDEQHRQMHMESARRWDAMIELRDVHASCNHNHENITAKSNNAAAVMAPANTYLVLDLPAEAPNDMSATSTQTLVTTAGDPNASPYGWTSTDGATENTFTKGNNVYAFYDPSPSPLGGAPNPGTAAQATSLPGTPVEFKYPWDLTQEPEYSTTNPNNQFPNRNAAIVNLFYWNNLVHDIFYNFGFTETGRNFQFENDNGNGDSGGMDNDEVLAQAQDGGGTNNANFLTLTDGVNGQMQMYLWTSPMIDSLVQINTVDMPTTVMGGDKFESLQGALYNSAMPINLNTSPVLNRNYVLVNDGCTTGSNAGDSEGCGAGGGVGVAPCNNVTNAIVLIDRGSCSFAEKVDGAQKGGAAGVIVMNNDTANPDAILAMGGTDPTINTITIPSVMVSYNTGLLLKAALASGAVVNGSLKQDNPPIPKKDGDFDNGIIAHEYGHGISTRTSPQNGIAATLTGDEQGGEGWADYYALYLTTTQSDLVTSSAHPNGMLPDRGIGTYVTYTNSNGPGIRPRKYSVDLGVNEYTLAGSTNGGLGIGNAPEITIPHGIGFIWCTMLWEMTQQFVDEYGFNDDKYYNPPTTGNQTTDIATLTSNSAGNNLALKLIQEGISMQSPSPSFINMRDGILKADSLLYGAAHSCMIWEAFAKRGLGFNAQNPTNNIGDEVDGFGVPTACNANQVFYDIVKTSSASTVGNLQNITYTLTVTNTSPTGSTGTNVDVVDALPAGMSFISGSGAPFTETNNIVTFTISSIAANASVAVTIEALVNNAVTSTILEEYDYEASAQGWTVASGANINTFGRVNDSAEAHGGNFYFYTTNLGFGGDNATLTSPMLDPNLTNQQIRFWHKFDAQAGFDGGFLETTTDGLIWTRLPLQENGYNGALNSTFNPANAGVAFTGTQVNYIESAGLLPAGTTQVRFVFSEDNGFGGGDGWFIDNVLIVQNPVTITNTATVTDPIANGGRVHSSEASVLITPFVCPLDLLITAGNIPDMTYYYAQNSIIIDGMPNDVKVLQGKDASIIAGNFVQITSDFEVVLGATFLMDIDGCP